MVVGVGTIELYLGGINSLKEKRSILQSLKARLHKEFNVAVGEVALHDVWQSASLGVAAVSTSADHAVQIIETVVAWVEHHRPDLEVVGYTTEAINI